MAQEFNLEQLADASDIPARTIRYYIARGLLKGPLKAGRGATYGPDHLERLQQIKRLQAQGRTLGEVEAILAADSATTPNVDASPWWRYEVAEDIVVMARADVSPWRSRLIRETIRELGTRLTKNRDKEEEKR